MESLNVAEFITKLQEEPAWLLTEDQDIDTDRLIMVYDNDELNNPKLFYGPDPYDLTDEQYETFLEVVKTIVKDRGI